MESVASSSSSSSPGFSTPPSVLPAGEYEVFLSFRGPDVRNTFADHLYTSLSRSKIRTFRDEEELPIGEAIAPSLLRAISESKIYIAILTEHYASSKWCLQEMAQMVECWKRQKGHLFLPIFYFVDPRDVRHQQGPYQQPFGQHAQKHSSQTVKQWKEALQEVGKMKGWHVRESDGQGAVVEQVLSEVELHLRSIYTLVTDDLVGIDIHVKEVMELLNLGSPNGKVIGIHGMGGIGKTTLSKAVYNKIGGQFDRCCFLEDVRETLTKSDGALSLQNKVISTILKHDYQVKNISEGLYIIKERVCKHKVLLFVDDIDDTFDFDKLLGNLGDFSPESRFIFTTRDKRVSDFLLGCKLHEVGQMNHQHSLQLFSKHAFGTDHPPEDAATLSEEFIKVAAGLPLALKVIGSLLFRREKAFWEEKLIEMQDIPPTGNKVQGRLKISYNELTHNEKQIFLDIACLFIGMNKDLPCYMWSGCNLYPESGINTLILRSLIKLQEGNRFWMHDHIRDLGRAIVKEEDVQHPSKRSRIWSTEDALDMLRNGEGNDQVEVLRIVVGDKDGHEGLTHKEFEKLSRLRYLEVCNVSLTGDFSEILPNIRWLKLFQCDSIPTDLNMKKLAILDLRGCPVKDVWRGWNGIKSAHKLKVINLWGCLMLKRAPDLSWCASLESIDVYGCSEMRGGLHISNFKNLKTLKLERTMITDLTGEVGMLQQLQEINARDTDVRELPVGIDKLSCLKILNLESRDRINLQHMELPRLPASLKRLSISSRGGIPNLLELKDLEYLSFLNSHEPQIPGDICQLPNLKELTLSHSPCGSLLVVGTQPTSPTAAAALPSSLKSLHVEYCRPLKRLPSLSNLNRLTVLKLIQLEALEIHGLGELRALETMVISDAPNLNNLVGLENLILLTYMSVTGCGVLEKLPGLANLIKLQILSISSCRQLTEVTGVERLVSLGSMIMRDSPWIRKLSDLSALQNLKKLDVGHCTNLTDVTGIERLESLQELDMSGCCSIKELPNLSGLRNLEVLNISRCKELTKVTGIERLESLQSLLMSNCISIKVLPDLSGLQNLKLLDVCDCIELIEVSGIERLQSLEKLFMSGCRSVKELGDLSGLEKLWTINVRGCTQLAAIKGLEELEHLSVLRMGTRLRMKHLLESNARYRKRLVNRFGWL